LKARLLLGTDVPEEELGPVAEHADILRLSELDEVDLDSALPSIDCLLVHFWPERLTRARTSRMTGLSMVQSVLAGVNHIPFGELSAGAVVCSNAGGYSDEVGEFAWGLLLSAAKRIVKVDAEMRRPGYQRPATPELGREVLVLKGKALGVLGFGGIGRTVAGFGRAFGMDVTVYSRRGADGAGVRSVQGRRGLETLLKECDAIVLALPHTKSTDRLIGRAELSLMKPDAVLVNVARAELVDEEALFHHLVSNKKFVYATDVWWLKGGRESYAPDLPFLELDNFIGTPHASGPSAIAGRGPLRRALTNVARFLRGEQLLNVVDRNEYG
jgi:phosphoglycerate dehydrogenase-like enzyme